MSGPRRGKPIQPRTLAICAEFDRRKAGGEQERDIVGDLKDRYGVTRTSIWKALRSGGSVPRYQPTPARLAQLAEVSRQIMAGEAEPEPKRQAAHNPRVSPDARPAPVEPCGRCGVRADVGCPHRPPAGEPPPAIADPGPRPDRRFRHGPAGQGSNFQRHDPGLIPNAIERLAVRRLNPGDDQA